MLRSLVLIFSCMCVAVVLSEAAGIMLLWQQGLLTPHHLHEIQLVFTSDPSDAERETDVANAKPLASLQEVTQARAIKVFELDRREAELNVLKNMASSKALELETQQAAFRAQRKAFEEELAALKTQQSSAAIEQARGVLLALPPRDAVEKLMAVTLEQDVSLLKGMPEKMIAKILKEFNAAPEQVERGRKIFEAIGRGEPENEFLKSAASKFESNNGPAGN